MMQTQSVTTSRAHELINFSVENAELSWQPLVPDHMPQFRLQSHTKPKRKIVRVKIEKHVQQKKKKKPRKQGPICLQFLKTFFALKNKENKENIKNSLVLSFFFFVSKKHKEHRKH